MTDGAEALQDQLQTKLSHFPLALDFIHVDEYLWKAGTALYGETDPKRAVWVETQLLDLWLSRTKQVIQRLEDKAKTLGPRSQARRVLQQVAGYLRRNQAHMDYATYLKRGWPIGTGVIEGGVSASDQRPHGTVRHALDQGRSRCPAGVARRE